MQPLSGPGTPIAGERPPSPGKTAATDDQPLSPAQRTTLEKLIVKIMTLSPAKSAEIWATLRHDPAPTTAVNCWRAIFNRRNSCCKRA